MMLREMGITLPYKYRWHQDPLHVYSGSRKRWNIFVHYY